MLNKKFSISLLLCISLMNFNLFSYRPQEGEYTSASNTTANINTEPSAPPAESEQQNDTETENKEYSISSENSQPGADDDEQPGAAS